MGCISSKLLSTTDLDQGFLYYDSKSTTHCSNHVVSLTSTTYGVLNLDHYEELKGKEESSPSPSSTTAATPSKASEWKRSFPTLTIPQFKTRAFKEGPPEIINALELMEDLADETPIWSPLKNPTKPHPLIRRSASIATSTMSPKKQNRILGGKENNPTCRGSPMSDPDPNRALRPLQPKNSPVHLKIHNVGKSSRFSGSRRSLSPVFDPELLASFERELCEEGEQIKKVVHPFPKNRRTLDSIRLLESFDEKCPPGGEGSVVLYSTTLRGIRKTFEDCNAVRSAIEASDIQITERDISMDSGFREELRVLMGTKEVRVPLVFVKGRLIGGAEEIQRLEEEGRLDLLLEGIPKAAVLCEGCAGVRFLLCMNCSGSCKVLDEEEKKMVKCGECNENGLIHCPICC